MEVVGTRTQTAVFYCLSHGLVVKSMQYVLDPLRLNQYDSVKVLHSTQHKIGQGHFGDALSACLLADAEESKSNIIATIHQEHKKAMESIWGWTP